MKTCSKNTSTPRSRLFLDCSFDDNQNVKRMGGRWDRIQRKWYIPEGVPVSKFHRWLPRRYLDCAYEEKDRVKALGAKWDGTAKFWYVPETIVSLRKFDPWIFANEEEKQNHPPVAVFPEARGSQVHMTPKRTKDRKATQPTKAKTERPPVVSIPMNVRSNIQRAPKNHGVGGSKATLPRISADMTVPQLREECLARNPAMKGLGSKTKPWLLDHLGIASAWTCQCRNVRMDDRMSTTHITWLLHVELMWVS